MLASQPGTPGQDDCVPRFLHPETGGGDGELASRRQIGVAKRGGAAVAREWTAWRHRMLGSLALILIVLWLLGVVSGSTLGNFIYVLLIVAIVLFLVRLLSGRRVV